jgi:hypothetical protein
VGVSALVASIGPNTLDLLQLRHATSDKMHRAHKISLFIVLTLFSGITTICASEPPREPWTKDDIFGELRKNTEKLLDTDFGKSEAVNLQGILKSAQYIEKELNKRPYILKQP